MLINPMDTAAADVLRVSVGKVQKGALQKNAATAVKQSHIIVRANG